MTLKNITIKAFTNYALNKYFDDALNAHFPVKKKSPSKFFQSCNSTIKNDYLESTKNFLSILSDTKNYKTFCDAKNMHRFASIKKLQINDRDYAEKIPFSMDILLKDISPFIVFLSQKYQENPHINTLHIKPSSDSLNITFEDVSDTTTPLLNKKIYDIAMDEMPISKIEGICYKNKMNGQYMRIHHFEECPDISILKIGNDNNYILSPSKAYFKKIDSNNISCSFKNMVLRNNPSDNEILKQLFTVIAKITRNGKTVSIIDTQNTTFGTCFRVSIE